MDTSSSTTSSIELKIMHCKDLQAFNFFQKLNIYVLISITPNNNQQKHRTPTDKENDNNPEWNHVVKLQLPDNVNNNYEDVFIEFDLKHEGQYFGDKTIGIVKVPLKDLLDEQQNGILRFVNYQVNSPEDGKPNGVLNFCYKVDNTQKIADLSTHLTNISGFSTVSHQDHSLSSNDGIHYPCLSSFSEPHYPAFQESYYPPPPLPPAVEVYPPVAPPVYPPVMAGPEVAHVVSHHHYGPSDGQGWGMYGDSANGYGYNYGQSPDCGQNYDGSVYWR